MSACPSREQFEGFLGERLSAAERAALETHVESCVRCQETLQQLSGGEPLPLAHASGATAVAPDAAIRLTDRDEAILERMKKTPLASRSSRPGSGGRLAEPAELPVIPGYEILGKLGHGAAGVVYKARQLALNRLVALKMILGAEYERPEDWLRFRIEGELIARLHHPNIVQIHEVGSCAGRPFFALEFVDGGSLADRLDGTPQPPRQAAELIEALARAVQAAHLQGIVHRDLKPANILLATAKNPTGSSGRARQVTAYGVPMITDFGLAKQLQSDVRLTQSGSVVGTPRYMSPEQCRGDAKAIGPATDVYALGTILYELLTGRVPFPSEEVVQVLHQVVEEEPLSPRRLRPNLPRDLECIGLRCLEKEPRRRYASAEALADDLRRFLDGKPIRARPVGAIERTWKWARRRPLVAALGLGLVLVIGLALVGMTGALLYAVAGWDLAQKQQQEAVAARNDAQLLAARLTLDRGIALAEQGEVAGALHFLYRALEMAPADATDLRWLVRINLAAWSGQVHGLRQVLPHPARLRAGAVSPDGQTLVTGGDDAFLRRWDVATGRLLGTFPKAHGLIQTLAFSPDGKTVVTAGGGKADYPADVNCAIELWEATTEKRLGTPWLLEKQIWGIAFSPDGRWLASIGNEPCLRLWNTGAGGPTPILTPRTSYRAGVILESILITGEGQLLAGGRDGVVRVWDPADGQELLRWPAHTGSVRALALHPGGRFVASAGHDGRVRLWHLATGRAAGEMQERIPSSVAAVAFSPDGALLIGACNDSHARIWDVATGCLLGNRPQHQSLVSWLTVAAGGRLLLTGGHDKTVRVWDVARVFSRPADSGLGLSQPFGPSAPPRHSPGWFAQASRQLVHRVDFSPAGQTALLLGDQGMAWLWDAGTDRPRSAPLPHPYDRVRAAAFSPDGRVFATTCHQAQTRDCVLRFWDAATGAPRSDWLAQPNWVAALAFSPDSKLLAAGDYADSVRLLDVATARLQGEPIGQNDIVLCVAFSPDGRTLAAGTTGQPTRAPQVQVWDLGSRKRIGQALGHSHWIVLVVYAPDGRAFVTRSYDHSARLWNAATGEPLSGPLLHPRGLASLAFSPDSRLLVTGGADGAARLWHVPDGKLLGRPMLHPPEARRVAFSPDGRMVVVGSDEGSLRLWDVATQIPLGPPVFQGARVFGVAFAADGRSFFAVSADGAVRAWPVPAPFEGDGEQLKLRLQVRTGLEMDPTGQAVLPLELEAWEERRGRLEKGDGSAHDPIVTGPDDAAWHDSRARDAEQDSDSFAALWHLDRLTALRPGDWLLWARRGRLHTSAGRFDEAAAAYQRAIQLGSRAQVREWYQHRAIDCRLRGHKAAAVWYSLRLGAIPLLN